MQSLINSLAFSCPPTCSYDKTLSYLFFIKKLPVRYYHDGYDHTVLLCHSNGEDIGQFNIEALADTWHANICMFDYAGYGMHPGSASEASCQCDVKTVYHYLLSLGITNIIIYGRSIGTGVACYLAYYIKKPVKLILVSPFKSVTQVILNLWCPWDFFKNDKIAQHIAGPVLIIHGCRDRFCDYQSSRELSLLFKNMTFKTIHGAGHFAINTCPEHDEAIYEFIQ